MTRPDRFAAVAGLSVPFWGIARRAFSQIFDEVCTRRDRFFYPAWFQKEGPPEAEAEADIRGFLRRIHYAISGDAPAGTWPDKRAAATLLEGVVDPDPFPAWLSDADIDHYDGEFEASGLRGPLNRYRNHERDFAWTRPWADARITQPCLFIGGTKDSATTPFGAIADPVATMRMFAPRVEGHILPDIGHWTQQEAPEAVTRLLLDWLGRVRTGLA